MFIKWYAVKNYVGLCVIIYLWCGQVLFVCDVENFECVVKMDKDQWLFESIMSEEVDMNDENENKVGVNEEEHVDYSYTFNISQVIM